MRETKDEADDRAMLWGAGVLVAWVAAVLWLASMGLIRVP